MTRTTRLTRMLVGALAVAVLAGGCGGAAKQGDSGGSGASAARTKAVRYAECMRQHGVPAFPDPDASGQLTMDGVANGSSLDTGSAAFRQALQACRDLQPPGFAGSKSRDAKAQEAALAFARCIREHGVKDFPDPVDGEPLIDTNRIPSANAQGGMSILNAAIAKCRDAGRAAIEAQR